MENVNYIYGKTPQDELITFDGFRVESYAIYEDEEEGTLVDLLFKSGGYVTVYAHVDEGSEIIDSLLDCESALKKNPDLLAKHYPVELIGCDTPKNKEFFFDGNTVEYYTQEESDDDDLVELHFVSGHVVEVFNELDEDLYPGESVETLVDDCICRYMKDEHK
jgi:hypothetical protein